MTTDKIELGAEKSKNSECPEVLKSNFLIELKERVIDNPGKGNCGFYAFAIALIDIIQEERTYNCTTMFDQWVRLDDSIKGYYNDICKYDFDKPNHELLEALHRILRVITFDVQLTELRRACAAAKKKDEYKALVATSTYRKFAELYYGKDVDPHFNEFAKSSAIKSVIAKIKRSKVVVEHEALVLAPAFMSLLYGEGIAPESITLGTEPSPTSPIIQTMQNITEDFVWAGHLELDYLARAFEVNLHTLENGTVRYPFQDQIGRHTITVNNQSNVHWTTKVTMAKVSKILTSDSLASGAVPQGSSGKKTTEEHQKPPVKNEPEQQEKVVHKKSPDQIEDPLAIKKLEGAKKLSSKPSNPKHSTHKKAHSSQSDEIPLQLLNPDEAQKKLTRLILKVNRAVIGYCCYSDSIWFSFFHRHGESGRERAKTFNRNFATAESYAEAREMLLDFLKDKKNGNTYPHSFRTMLLQELLDTQSKKKIDLKIISKNYNGALAQFEKQLLPAATSEMFVESVLN